MEQPQEQSQLEYDNAVALRMGDVIERYDQGCWHSPCVVVGIGPRRLAACAIIHTDTERNLLRRPMAIMSQVRRLDQEPWTIEQIVRGLAVAHGFRRSPEPIRALAKIYNRRNEVGSVRYRPSW